MTASVSFGGLSLDVDPYHIVSIEGLAGSPEVRSADRPRLARHGLVAGRDLRGGRTVTITMNVSANAGSETTFNSAVSALLEAFAVGVDDEAPLTFTIRGIADGTAAQVNVRPRKLALPLPSSYFSNLAEVAVELFATDPLIYAASESSSSLELATASGGATFPLTFDLTFGASGDFGTITATNLGNAPSPPSFVIHGPVTNPSLRNETTDQEITVGIVLASGETLEIDVQNRTVLLNGTASRYSSLTSAEWWELQPGNNEVRYSAAVSTASTVTMTWRSAWA